MVIIGTGSSNELGAVACEGMVEYTQVANIRCFDRKSPLTASAVSGDALFLPFCGPLSKKRPLPGFMTGQGFAVLDPAQAAQRLK